MKAEKKESKGRVRAQKQREREREKEKEEEGRVMVKLRSGKLDFALASHAAVARSRFIV